METKSEGHKRLMYKGQNIYKKIRKFRLFFSWSMYFKSFAKIEQQFQFSSLIITCTNDKIVLPLHHNSSLIG